ncbi:hypothetical protein EHQ58_11325 [Leptospira ognonensis]|uniref:Uncharacterized protein n=1 Tax=Leptospira ognonensis TaxID=2484945 RepID=A0A4R9JZ34_9LEPT|nr:hypothetical protein [Leptospira ognonensis]TGL57984.1 hypothetical protein EHQ58_11325 [Leptospira ognonensis]
MGILYRSLFSFNFFLLCFQFIAIGISQVGFDFPTKIIFAFFFSILFSKILLSRFLKKLKPANSGNPLLVFTLSAALTYIFGGRINPGFFDGHCPTNLIHLTSQIMDQRFPVSFTGFPEFPANYHQGFILYSGLLAKSLHLSAVDGIYFSFLFFVFNLNLLILTTVNILNPGRLGIFFVSILLLTASSFPRNGFIQNYGELQGWYEYIHLLEYFSSNSWPLGYITPVLLVFLFSKGIFNRNFRFIFIAFCLVMFQITANASVFSVFLLILFVTLVVSLLYEQKVVFSRYTIIELSKYIFFLLLALLLSKVVPSATMSGPEYDPVQILVFNKSWESILEYFRLSGPLVFIYSFLLISLLRKNIKISSIYKIVSFGICFGFPLLFTFKQINEWDNLHKFALMSIFVSVINLPLSNWENKKTKSILMVLLILLISFGFSISILINLYLTRSNFRDIFSIRVENLELSEEAKYFQNKKEKSKTSRGNQDFTIYPLFPVDSCTPEAVWACYSKVFVRGVYHPNFLVNDALEEESLGSAKKYMDLIQSGEMKEICQSGKMFLLKKDQKYDILNRQFLKEFKQCYRAKVTEFSAYILIETD